MESAIKFAKTGYEGGYFLCYGILTIFVSIIIQSLWFFILLLRVGICNTAYITGYSYDITKSIFKYTCTIISYIYTCMIVSVKYMLVVLSTSLYSLYACMKIVIPNIYSYIALFAAGLAYYLHIMKEGSLNDIRFVFFTVILVVMLLLLILYTVKNIMQEHTDILMTHFDTIIKILVLLIK